MKLQKLVEDYLTNQTSENFENLYLACKQIISYQVSNNLYPDKAELEALAEDTLIKCLRCYDIKSGIKFSTYFSSSVKNAFKNLYRNNLKHINTASCEELNDRFNFEKSNDHSNDTKFVESVSKCTDESEMSNIEVNDTLNYLKSKLTENEFKVCECIVNTEGVLEKKEIAKTLNITAAGVGYILKSIAKKITRQDILQFS